MSDKVHLCPHLEEQVCLQALAFNDLLRGRRSELLPQHFKDKRLSNLWKEITRRIENGLPAKPAFMGEWGALHGFTVDGLLRLVERAHAFTDDDFDAACKEVSRCAERRAVRLIARDFLKLDEERLNGDAGTMLTMLQNMAALGEKDLQVDMGAWKRASDVARAAVEKARKGQMLGISTGIPELDELTNGGKPAYVWVVGGATSMGKSIVGQQIGVNVAGQRTPKNHPDGEGRPYGVGYIHLEMTEEDAGLRLAAGEAFEAERMFYKEEESNPYYLSAARNKLFKHQWERMLAACEKLDGKHLYLDDRPGRTITQIEAAGARLFRQMRRDGVVPGLLIIDHEGLIAPEEKRASELEYARARGQGIKDLAKRLAVWTLVLSQITKESSKLDGETALPTSQDLNYGSALSQGADAVILLHRKTYYLERKPKESLTADEKLALHRFAHDGTLNVDKARGGRRGKVEVLIEVGAAAVVQKAAP